MSLKFKSSNERDEYVSLGQHNPKLVDLLIDLTDFVRGMYSKDVVITEVFRTPDEQTKLYAEEEKKVLKSPHSYWKAVDLRSWIYTSEEVTRICEYLNLKYKNKSGKPVAIFHRIAGGGDHIHAQLTD